MLLSKKYVSNQTHVIENLTDYTRFKCKNFGLDRSSHQKERRLSLLGIKGMFIDQAAPQCQVI